MLSLIYRAPGGDADNAGAVYGQLADSFYGLHALPERFLKFIKEKEEIEELVTKLLTLTKSTL
jgi:ADP-ribosylglycohydrolase